MNTYFRIALVALSTCLLFSCSDELIVQQEPVSVPMEDDGLVAYPKAMANTRSMSIEQNWEEWKTVELSTGADVETPWSDRAVMTAIPGEIRKDVKAENGWNLIAHTVNGYGEPGKNYLIFHNKYTGILKVFYYLEPGFAESQNTAMWMIFFETPSAHLAFAEEYAALSTQKDSNVIYTGNITNTPSKGFTPGWNCFQITLAYDPNFTTGDLQFNPYNMTTKDIKLSGTIETTTEGLLITATKSNIFDNAVVSAANFVGGKAEKWVKNAVSQSVFKEIGSFIVKGAGSIVSSGVSTLLGFFTGGFDETGQTTQAIQLRTSGTITLPGTLEEVSSSPVGPLSFPISTDLVGKLGAWSLKRAPTLRLNPYGLHVGQHPDHEYVQLYDIQVPYIYSLDLEDVIDINPEALSQIEGYSISGTIYETNQIVANDVLHQGIGSVASTFGGEYVHLYKNLYAPREIWPGVVLKDINGNDLANFEANAPLEAYIPNRPDGQPGAQPNFTFDSGYVLAITVRFVVNNNGKRNYFESTHMCVPKFAWDYDISPGAYYYSYPYVPIDVNAPIFNSVLQTDSSSVIVPLAIDSEGVEKMRNIIE